MPARRITYRQQIFVLEYLIDLDGTHAAIRAGYKPSGARVQGARLLRRPDIAAAIQHEMDERARRTGITPERVIEEYARVVFAEMRLVAEADRAGIADLAALTDEEAAALAALAELPPLANQRAAAFRVATSEKIRALDGLALMLGFDLGVPRGDTDRLH